MIDYLQHIATQQAVRAHITLKVKSNKNALLLVGLGLPEPARRIARAGPRPPPAAAAAALAAGEALAAADRSVEDYERYFHKGLHNLSGAGPGFRIIHLDLADAEPTAGAVTGGGPGLLAGGSASILPRLYDSGTESGSDSESELPMDQRSPEPPDLELPAEASPARDDSDPGEKCDEIL